MPPAAEVSQPENIPPRLSSCFKPSISNLMSRLCIDSQIRYRTDYRISKLLSLGKMKIQHILRIAIFSGFVGELPPVGASVILMDQIGDATSYSTASVAPPSISQIYTDFPDYSSMVVEDLGIIVPVARVVGIEVLLRAEAGFSAFAGVESYRLSIFSSYTVTASGLVGDVFNQTFTPGINASVTQIGDGGLGLVLLTTDITLDGNTTYWIGVAPVSANSVTGAFHLLNGGAQGPAAGGNDNAKFINPEDAFEIGEITDIGSNAAYRITVIPEPGHASLIMISASLLFLRRRGLIPCPHDGFQSSSEIS